MDGQFFSEYYKNDFLNQQILHDKLSTPDDFVRELDSVPLTTCLLIAKDNLQDFEKEILKYNQALLDFQNKIHTAQRSNNFQLFQTYSPQRIILNTSGSATYSTIPSIEITPNMGGALSMEDYKNSMIGFQASDYHFSGNCIIPTKDDVNFRDIVVYMRLYSYLAVFGTILDRFSCEINNFYNLGIPNIDWIQLVKKMSDNKNNPTKVIEIENEIINYENINGRKILKHRNRFVHDGYAKISVTPTLSDGWKIYLREDPRNISSPFSFDVIQELPLSFNHLLSFVNNSYGILSSKIDVDGQPPW
ncbi:MAG TPA: hypothetical protein DIW44_16075 [Anaerolineaceae bacterium]|nr:hypothetical protein [Anaerolineaceae bacterium]